MCYGFKIIKNYLMSFLLIATQDKNEDNARKIIDTIIDLIMFSLN